MRQRMEIRNSDVVQDVHKKDDTVQVELGDLTTLMMLALRYSFTRRTGIGYTVRRIITRYIDEIPPATLAGFRDDVLSQIGMAPDQDTEMWLSILDSLKRRRDHE